MQAPTIAHQPLPSNYFVQLNAINVNDHLEKKGGFSYLSWPYAVAQLRTADPTATWEVRRFNGLPYLATEAGVFVEVTVTVRITLYASPPSPCSPVCSCTLISGEPSSRKMAGAFGTSSERSLT